MDDSVESPAFRRNFDLTNVINSKKVPRRGLLASIPKSFSCKSLKRVTSPTIGTKGSGTAVRIACFILKVAALETVRRFSRARCPPVWPGLQALQVLCYPPFRWIQRWYPFRGLVHGIQMLSRPLLFLSIATAFSDQLGCCDVSSDGVENSSGNSDHQTDSQLQSENPSIEPTFDARICDDVPENLPPTNWLLRLYAELKNEGITMPDRINEDELQRFYAAASGDFSCLLASVKKTIRWRETYLIFSQEELEMWSTLVFWHGFDVKHQPCLVVRLGLACTTLQPHDRPCFVQAIVSQVEHGILHLVDNKNPQITVLVDCEGLSPLKFPLQMMKTCSNLLQDHFPNSLGCLFVIRLPPLVRVTAQTFIQILKPTTRRKLQFEGEAYQKILSKHFQTLPLYLGGMCTCTRCANNSMYNMQQPFFIKEIGNITTNADSSDSDSDDLLSSLQNHDATDSNCDVFLRTAVVGILIFWILIAFAAGIFDPASRPTYPEL